MALILVATLLDVRAAVFRKIGLLSFASNALRLRLETLHFASDNR